MQFPNALFFLFFFQFIPSCLQKVKSQAIIKQQGHRSSYSMFVCTAPSEQQVTCIGNHRMQWTAITLPHLLLPEMRPEIWKKTEPWLWDFSRSQDMEEQSHGRFADFLLPCLSRNCVFTTFCIGSFCFSGIWQLHDSNMFFNLDNCVKCN